MKELPRHLPLHLAFCAGVFTDIGWTWFFKHELLYTFAVWGTSAILILFACVAYKSLKPSPKDGK